DRTQAELGLGARARRAPGGGADVYGDGGIDEGEAAIVPDIFREFANGGKAASIAMDLNRRHIAAPRSREGWHSTGVRVILRNERYIGRMTWNQREWRKDPDSGARHCVLRPRSEWISYEDPSQRMVSDELWTRVQQRSQPPSA